MALTEQFNLISLPETVADAFAQLQDNFYFLLMAAARQAITIPDWTMTATSTASPEDYCNPDYITFTKTYTTESPQVTRAIRIEFTYTEYGSPIVKHPTTLVFKFKDGSTSPEFETVTGGTITVVYDGAAGNVKSATSA